MLTIIGALLGALFGGFAGLVIGGLVGYAAGFAFRQFVVGSLRVAQSQLIDSTFAIMGALCDMAESVAMASGGGFLGMGSKIGKFVA